MSTQSLKQTEFQYKIGYWILQLLSIATAINSLVRLFLEPVPEFVVGWVAAGLFAAVVLFIPFRKGEPWAWYVTWILPVLLASVFIVGAQVGIYYLVMAIVAVFALLLTRSLFFQD